MPGHDDDNSCLEGTLAGGVLGGIGGVLPKRQLDLVDSAVHGGAIGGYRSMAVDCLSKISLL